MNERTRQSALKALEGMEEIVKADMLVHGDYHTDVLDLDLANSGAICGGRKYCAVGALWVGGGIRVQAIDTGGFSPEVRLPGVYAHEREDFLRRRPGLRLAYETLNEIALAWAKRTKRLDDLVGYSRDEYDDWDADVASITIETVFENAYCDRNMIGRRDMLRFIKQARERIEALPVAA